MSTGGRVRVDGRTADQMRPLKITPDFISTAEGSVLIELGNTRVICTATVDDGVPGFLKSSPLIDTVAATSVGIVDDRALLDLAYKEDSRAEVDMNVVMTGNGHFVEIQATAEGRAFSGSEMQDLLALAAAGIRRLTE